MAFLDATKKINNSKLSELNLLKNQKYIVDKKENELVTFKGKYEFRLSGDLKVKNKELKGQITGIKVLKNGDEIYRLSELKINANKFFDAVNDGDIQSIIPTMFEKKDTIEGSFFDDKLYGYNKNDKINGYGGDDIIHGGKGNDILTGYTGKDAFVFDTKLNAKNNVDRITDWDTLKNQNGKDSIWLDKGIFKAFKGMSGELKKKYFVTGSEAKEEDDHIIYKKNKNKVYYDEDGKGGEGKILFAKIDSSKKVLTHNDFDIV